MLMSSGDMKKYPCLTRFVYHELPKVRKKPKVWRAFLKYSELSHSQALDALTKCSNPTLGVKAMPGSNGRFNGKEDKEKIWLSKVVAEKFESDFRKPKARLLIESTVLHEMVHWGDYKDGHDPDYEEGKEFEKEAYGKDINRYW